MATTVYLVTRGIYSNERAAGIYPTLARAKGQFPDASWRILGWGSAQHAAEDVVVGHWPGGDPIHDAVTIYEMPFDQDITERSV
jgi:hypothetical protein